VSVFGESPCIILLYRVDRYNIDSERIPQQSLCRFDTIILLLLLLLYRCIAPVVLRRRIVVRLTNHPCPDDGFFFVLFFGRRRDVLIGFRNVRRRIDLVLGEDSSHECII